jgi:putative DNA primase/helicase
MPRRASSLFGDGGHAGHNQTSLSARGDKFDVLDPDGGDAAFAEAAEYGVDLSALHSITGGGKHYPFKLPEGITLRNKVKDTGDWPLHHCDARAEGRYIVAPPSRHASGRSYEWSAPFDLANLPEVPLALLEVWQDPPDDPRNAYTVEDEAPGELDDIEIQEGDARGEVTALYFVGKYTRHALSSDTAGRNEIGLQLALQLRDNGISQEGAKTYMRQYQQAVATCRPDIEAYTWAEAESTLKQVYSRPARQPIAAVYQHNDGGNARRFADKYGKDYRYSPDMKQWIRWDGIRFDIDEKSQVQERVKALAVDIFAEAANITDETAARHHRAWAVASGNGGHITHTLRLATSVRGIPVMARELDANPMLLAFPNGYYDLATDDLNPPNKADLVTKVCAAPYIAGARHDLWDWALNRFIPDPAERLDIQTALAYCLTGRAKEHAFIAEGGTKSGKSTIFNAVRAALGHYALTININTFTTSKYEDGARAREDLVAMVGRRLVIASEANQNTRMNAAMLKRVTGNDALAMRANYGKQFESTPVYGMWLLVNDLPKLPADDPAIWERVHVFHFREYIKPEDRDEALRDRTVDPAVTGSAVLAWLLEGWKRLRDDLDGKLVLPTTQEATRTYRDAQDVLAQFIGECCTEGPEFTTRYSEFKEAFRRFLRREDIHEQYTDTRIGRALAARGYESFRSGAMKYRGLQVIDPLFEVHL